MKLVREHINEIFSETSDPIKDMGIGVFAKHDFNTEDKLYDFLADSILLVLGIDNLPKIFIASTPSYTHTIIKSTFSNKLSIYIAKYLTVLGNRSNRNFSFELAKRLKENTLIATRDQIEHTKLLTDI